MKHHAIRVPGVVSKETSLTGHKHTAFSGPIISLRHPMESHADISGRWNGWLDTLKPGERQRKRKAMERLIEVARK